MLDKKESNMLFSGQRVNFNSLGTGTSHFQKTDMATSSYFIDMDIVEEISKKRKYMSLDNADIPGYSPVSCGSNQYYDNDNFTMRQEAEFDHINKVLLSNLRPAYIQQKEPSLFHETYKEEIANLRDVERNGLVKQLEQSGYQSEYNCDLVSTFLHDEDEQQIDTIIPHFPVVLETSNSEKACLGMESLLNNAFVSDGKQDTLTSVHKNQSVESNLIVNASSNNERLTVTGDEISANMDEQNKPINSQLSPVISEKIWDGSLKLNTSTTVSAIAFFKRVPTSLSISSSLLPSSTVPNLSSTTAILIASAPIVANACSYLGKHSTVHNTSSAILEEVEEIVVKIEVEDQKLHRDRRREATTDTAVDEINRREISSVGDESRRLKGRSPSSSMRRDGLDKKRSQGTSAAAELDETTRCREA
ncbi:hypothetical protein KSP40_PGU015705 [Platanthera guangdongensis]|uniref:Uncharacterized protein n=1 Tax=Platanthera guangdongensis TaxID=2320717 RepID=A0ABR2LVQ3_9ASPA